MPDDDPIVTVTRRILIQGPKSVVLPMMGPTYLNTTTPAHKLAGGVMIVLADQALAGPLTDDEICAVVQAHKNKIRLVKGVSPLTPISK